MAPGKHTCTDCSKTFTARSSLTRHTSAVHGSQRPLHHCSACSRAFASKSNLKRHVATVHEGRLKSFACGECTGKFSTKHASQRHVSAVHLHERDHVCERCRRGFNLASTLRHHARYCGEKSFAGKRFACSACSACFSLKSDLDVHRVNARCPQSELPTTTAGVQIGALSPDKENGVGGGRNTLRVEGEILGASCALSGHVRCLTCLSGFRMKTDATLFCK